MRLSLTAACLALLTGASQVSAQPVAEAPPVALFKTASEDSASAELGVALDPVVLSELSAVPGVRISARPALDLPSMQLAIDCVGETAECLRASAKQVEAEGLVAPSVRRVGSETIVTLLRYDAGQAIAMQGVSRRYAGARVSEDAIAGVRGMVRELYGLPDAAAQPEGPQPLAASPQPAAEPREPAPTSAALASEPVAAADGGAPVLAIVLGTVGVAFIGAGVGFGIASDNNADEFAATTVAPGTEQTRAQQIIRDANQTLDRAETQATLANVGFGVGAAALVASGVLLLMHLRERRPAPKPALGLAPLLGPGTLGLGVSSRWGAAP